MIGNAVKFIDRFGMRGRPGILARALVLAVIMPGVPAAVAQQDDMLLEGDLLSGETPAADDGGLLDGDLLSGPEPSMESAPASRDAMTEAETEAMAVDAAPDSVSAHQALFLDDRFPSAAACKTCHERQYRQWSVSQHAYAQFSPVFMAMQRFSNQRMSGTVGDFCIRCHTPVGMTIGESPNMNNYDRHPRSLEGITCVTCHRVSAAYGKVSARISVDEGSLFDDVLGPEGDKELERVLRNRDVYRVVTEPGESGRPIHRGVERFFPLVEPGFCGSCHDVTMPNGFRLEEAFSSFKASPAALERDDAGNGATCQDCHMGVVQGLKAGYDFGPAAMVGGVETEPRRLTNHYFAGPDFSIVHPGIFPHNVDAKRMATMREWVQFDYDAGWGTDAFENDLPEDATFPERWRSIDDRYAAREILDEQQKLLDWAREQRLEVLRNGYKLGDVTLVRADRDGIDFNVEVRNGTTGHNVPTGFIAERLVFLRVTVLDSDGLPVFLSGDLDANGDVRDSHSLSVLSRDVPVDTQLFNLQSHFMTLNNRGGEREQLLPTPYSVDVLPFVRPSTRSAILIGQPSTTRIQRKSIEPLGSKTANYHVDGDALIVYGDYTIEVELVVGMIPNNLINTIQDVGFDFDMSPRQVGDALVAGHETLWKKTIAFEIE
tara:strand:- start:185 stop:2164 length:1980 start_codon:yes stop_codon:yes gene_type:complete